MTWVLTPELQDEVCAWLETGKGLLAYEKHNLLNEIKRPCRSTILKWQREDFAFYTLCTRAREAGGEAHAEDLDDINYKVAVGLLDPNAARVISGNKQWIAARLASRLYGDKTKLEHTGVNGGPIEHKNATENDKAIISQYFNNKEKDKDE